MEQVFSKDTRGWDGNRDDFRGQDEIMVTITLHEYRELITRDAKHEDEKRKLKDEYYAEHQRANALRTKIDKLLEAAEEETEEE